jgi:hypothetical protein
MGTGFWATLPTRRAQFRVLQFTGVQISALVTRVRLPLNLSQSKVAALATL